MRRFFTTLLLLPVYFYKYCISPMTPASCRYYNTYKINPFSVFIATKIGIPANIRVIIINQF